MASGKALKAERVLCWESVPRASGLFLHSLSGSFFRERPQFSVKMPDTQNIPHVDHRIALHVCPSANDLMWVWTQMFGLSC